MTLVNVPTEILVPGNGANIGGARTTGASDTLDAAGEYTGMVHRAKGAMTISHVPFRTATVAGSPTIDVRIETVDAATGLPTGTLWATNTNIVSGALASNTWYLLALTSPAVIADGEVYCVKFGYNSGTSAQIAVANNAARSSQQGLPYGVRNTGTPAKFTAHALVAAVGSSATSFYQVPCFVPATFATAGVNTGTFDAHGARFKVPYKCRASGIIFPVASTFGQFTAGLYDDAGSELSSSSTAFDIDQVYQVNGSGVFLNFDNPVELAKDTWYRAAIWPTGATNTTLYLATLGSDDYRGGAFCGPNFQYTRKAVGGAWDDSLTTQYPILDLLIDQLDDGASAGGGAFFHASISG